MRPAHAPFHAHPHNPENPLHTLILSRNLIRCVYTKVGNCYPMAYSSGSTQNPDCSSLYYVVCSTGAPSGVPRRPDSPSVGHAAKLSRPLRARVKRKGKLRSVAWPRRRAPRSCSVEKRSRAEFGRGRTYCGLQIFACVHASIP